MEQTVVYLISRTLDKSKAYLRTVLVEDTRTQNLLTSDIYLADKFDHYEDAMLEFPKIEMPGFYQIEKIFLLRSKVNDTTKQYKLEPNLGNRLKSVIHFNKVFGHPVNDTPVAQPIQLVRNKIKYIQEELEELDQATQMSNLIEVLDALVDIDYFNMGIVAAFGLQDKYNEAFEIIHESNMSKLCKSIQEVEQTYDKMKKIGIECYHKEVEDNVWAVYNKENDKIMKSVNYKEPDLTVLFN